VDPPDFAGRHEIAEAADGQAGTAHVKGPVVGHAGEIVPADH